MSFLEITFRLILAIIAGGIIGYEREVKNRPAGIKTHILVCVGSTIIALIQMEVAYEVVALAATTGGPVNSDPVRLIAQVVSGIGFIGAGTIIFERGKLTGLTTAASIWVTSALGIALGMGFYAIVLLGSVTILVVLQFLEKIIKVHTEKKVEIRYAHRQETQHFLSTYLAEKGIEILNVDFNVTSREHEKIYTTIYTIDSLKTITYTEIVEDISEHKNIMRIRLISI